MALRRPRPRPRPPRPPWPPPPPPPPPTPTIRRGGSALLARNTTAFPITLVEPVEPVVTIAAGDQMNVTSELQGLIPRQYAAIEAQRVALAGGLAFRWTMGEVEFDVGTLDVGLSVPGPHASSHVAGGTDEVVVDTCRYGVHETFMQPEAPATIVGLLDQFAASAAPTAQPGQASTIDVMFPPAWGGGTITINGLGPGGETLSETFSDPNPGIGGLVAGVVGFAVLSSFANSAPGGAPGLVATIQTGPALALSMAVIGGLVKLAVDGVVEAPAAVDLVNGTVTPTTAKNGARDFEVYFWFEHDHDVG